MFNSRQYGWHDLTLVLGGRDVTGIRAIKYTEKVEREAVYGKGKNPHSIQTGNASYDGEISVLQSEYEALVQAGGGSIMGLSLDAVVSYGTPESGTIITDRIIGIQFTEAAKEIKQGDKFMEMKLPFMCLDVQNQS
ncbi:MAG: hypothetical protein RLZZ292_1051 [Bacteroidota bacterium]|jgi:hypothetical protein